MSLNNVVELKNLFFAWTKNYYSLFDISFEIKKGESVLLVGSDGSGKTTLMRIISGLEKNYTGQALISGEDAKKANFEKGPQVVYLCQNGIFFENKSVYKNLRWFYSLRKRKVGPQAEIEISQIINDFGLSAFRDIAAKRLSVFNRGRLALARASMRERIDLIMVDGSFDKMTENERVEFFRLVQAFETTIVVSAKYDIREYLNGDVRIINLELGSVKKEEEIL